ncbi:unnamed protein product [Meloidogyne enterolobii]|uniref:Uncharacterized protein n=1 Tax=Meloidogyne enterolobii TaxID=390850 RepID=A0ACB0Y586_MELEN
MLVNVLRDVFVGLQEENDGVIGVPHPSEMLQATTPPFQITSLSIIGVCFSILLTTLKIILWTNS